MGSSKKERDKRKASPKREAELILEYTKNERAAGYPMNQIRQKLLDAGYHKEAIERIFKQYNLNDAPKHTLKDFEHAVENEIKHIWDSAQHAAHNRKVLMYGSIIGVLCVMLVASLFFFTSFQKDCGLDSRCFLAYANTCENAKLLFSEYGTTVQLESTNECTLKKTVIDLDPSEPVAVENLFLGQSMHCYYESNSLTEERDLMLRSNLHNCEGQLKDAIYAVIVQIYGIEDTVYAP